MPEETDPIPAPTPGPTADDRLRVVRAYQSEAARQADPLAASLGFLTADLMAVAHGFGQALPAALAAGGVGLGSDPRVARLLDMYLKVLRQVDRFGALEQRLKAARPDGPPPTWLRR